MRQKMNKYPDIWIDSSNRVLMRFDVPNLMNYYLFDSLDEKNSSWYSEGDLPEILEKYNWEKVTLTKESDHSLPYRCETSLVYTCNNCAGRYFTFNAMKTHMAKCEARNEKCII